MKVYTYIKINMDTLEVEDEISYEYHGPVCRCEDGGDGGGNFGDPSTSFGGGPDPVTGGQSDVPGFGGFGGTDFGGPSGGNVWNRPDTASPATPTDVGEDDDLEALIRRMMEMRTDLLTRTLNEQYSDVISTSIADLVNRGVWQGDIGAKAMTDIYEEKMDAIQRGTLEIGARGSEMQAEMGWRSGEAALDRALRKKIAKWGYEASDDANKWGAFGNIAGGAMMGFLL